MLFRIFCVALFACSLTFAGCDEAADGKNDTPATVGDSVDAAGDQAIEVVTEPAAEEAVVVEETVTEEPVAK